MSRFILALALVAGCTGTKDDDADTDTDVADDTEVDSDTTGRDTDGQMPDFVECSDATSALGVADASPLGFSAQDVLDAAAASTQRDGQWSDDEGGGTTVVTVTLAGRGDPTFHDREVVEDTDPHTDLVEGPPLGAPDVDGACPDQLEIPVTVHLSTADGRFDETVDAALLVTDLAAFSVSGDLDWQHLGGTFTFQGLDPADWDTVSLDFGNAWDADGISGQVNVHASAEGSDTDNVSVGLTGPVLRWPGD